MPDGISLQPDHRGYAAVRIARWTSAGVVVAVAAAVMWLVSRSPPTPPDPPTALPVTEPTSKLVPGGIFTHTHP
jgi:hypothetical protein